jgi:raffinose/stachyose/melibiose transport system substrate-binding protein
VVVGLAATVLMLTGLSSCRDGEPTVAPTGGPVTLTWWHGSADEPMRGFWRQVADEFVSAHPNVTIMTSGHRAAMDIPPAPGADARPDLFEVSGGAELIAQVRAGALMDITELVGHELELIGASANGWSVEGRQYGLPYGVGIEGFWYRKSSFIQAGIANPPRTLDELNGAVVRLKSAGIIPIVVRMAEGWPAAHWWQNLVLRECPASVLRQSVADLRFSDPCFVRAGEDLATFVATDPFQPGWDTPLHPAQSPEDPTALFVRGQAAIQLEGHWHRSAMRNLAAGDAVTVLADVGWFPFPSVPGGQGDQGAVLASGVGFSCSAQAPPECVELLRYIVSVPVQARYGELTELLPAVRGAGATGYPAPMVQAQYDAGYVQLFLDGAYGPAVGQAMTAAALQVFTGQAPAQAVVDAMHVAAG